MTTQIGSGGPEAPRPPEVEEWRDKKRYLWLMGLIAPTALVVMLPLIWGMNQLGWHAAAQVPLWIGPILLYVLLPLLDLRFGPDGQNPPDEVTDRLENDKYSATAPTSTSRSSTSAWCWAHTCSPPQTSVGSALTAP